jgi:hypothetical protein
LFIYVRNYSLGISISKAGPLGQSELKTELNRIWSGFFVYVINRI